MAAAIGEPESDPHGAPIPTREGTLRERQLAALDSLPPGAAAVVERVGDRDADRLRYLAELGIIPGTSITVIAREPFGGPIAISVDGTRRTIGPELASQILVGARTD
jgi:DtxR family Mn-dependent transcriptional regulator